MSLALHSRSWSPVPPIFTQVVLGLMIPGVGVTTVLLSLYGYAAWNPVSRRYLDRVSFRLLTYALIAHTPWTTVRTPAISQQCSSSRSRSFGTMTQQQQLSLLFSAGMFFSIAINLPLVLALNIDGKNMEKYYVGGVTLIALVSNLAAYASGNLGWDDVNGTCWYHNKDPVVMLHWLVGTQSVWILLASLGEVIAFIVIVGYLVVYRLVPEDTPSSYASNASHRPGSTILRFRNIILRIVLKFYLLQNGQKNIPAFQQKNWRMYLADFAIYAGRPIIYGLLAATDSSFIRALRALRNLENESETLSQIRTPGLEMSTIIYLPQDEMSINEQDKDKETTTEPSLEAQSRVGESSTIFAPDINLEVGKARSLVDGCSSRLLAGFPHGM
ncbi:hypothetical protein C8R45DRAFT_933852 [Mycena sanguinolenta]|nr:hypothetical protein C8R45DRAFT_933852 [Mycena sanguinolenta]